MQKNIFEKYLSKKNISDFNKSTLKLLAHINCLYYNRQIII